MNKTPREDAAAVERLENDGKFQLCSASSKFTLHQHSRLVDCFLRSQKVHHCCGAFAFIYPLHNQGPSVSSVWKVCKMCNLCWIQNGMCIFSLTSQNQPSYLPFLQLHDAQIMLNSSARHKDERARVSVNLLLAWMLKFHEKRMLEKRECIRSILPIAQKSAHVHFVALLCVVVHIQDWWFHTKNVCTFFSTKNSLHASDSSCERTCVQLKDCKLRVAVVERWQKTLLGESVNSLKQTIIQKVVGTRQAMNKTLHMHEPACNATPTLTKP